jgi:cytochrome b6-f complex iron-sulfur subunit
MNRRAFLIRIIQTSCLALAAAGAGALVFIYPSALRQRRLLYLPVLDEDELPKRGVRKVEFSYTVDDRNVVNRAFLVADSAGLTAFSPVCTHLGCYVTWDNNRGEFHCPCHGGRYRRDGTVIDGPPPRPLDRLPLRIEAGKVLVGVTV